MSPRYEELIFGDIDLNSDAVFDEVMKYAMMPSTPRPADYDYSTHGRSFTQPLPQNVGGSNDTFGYMSMECSHSSFANEVATTHETTATLAQTARTLYSFGTSTISEPFIPDTVNPRLQQLEPAVGLEPALSFPQHSQSYYPEHQSWNRNSSQLAYNPSHLHDYSMPPPTSSPHLDTVRSPSDSSSGPFITTSPSPPITIALLSPVSSTSASHERSQSPAPQLVSPPNKGRPRKASTKKVFQKASKSSTAPGRPTKVDLCNSQYPNLYSPLSGAFRCMTPGCDATFSTELADAQKHYHEAHCDRRRKDPRRCPFPDCDQIMHSINDLRRHLYSEEHSRPTFRCHHESCTEELTRVDSLKRHLIVEHYYSEKDAQDVVVGWKLKLGIGKKPRK